jgi:hypothetical protein
MKNPRSSASISSFRAADQVGVGVLRRPCYVAAILLFITLPAQAVEVESVVGLYPAGEQSAMSVQIAVPQGQALAGLEWYHNDGSMAFPSLVLLEGSKGAAPDLENAALVLETVTGASLAWGAVQLEVPVTSTSGIIDCVFVLPPYAERTGEGLGGGPGIGYWSDPQGLPSQLSADGVEWSPLGGGFRLAVSPIWTSGSRKRAPVTLASLRESGEPLLSRAQDRTPPAKTELGAPYPNPFNPRVEIPFSLRRPQAVTLQVFDTRGRLVRTLLQEDVPAGTHRLVWTGVDRSGRSVASGVYHVRMDAGPERLTRSVTLVR